MWDYGYTQGRFGPEKPNMSRDFELGVPKKLNAPSEFLRSFAFDSVLNSPSPYDPCNTENTRFDGAHSRFESNNREDPPAASPKPVKLPFLLPEKPVNKTIAPEQPPPTTTPYGPAHPSPPLYPHPPPADWYNSRHPANTYEWSQWNTPEWSWNLTYSMPNHQHWGTPQPPAPPPSRPTTFHNYAYNGVTPPPPIAPPRWNDHTLQPASPRPSSAHWSSDVDGASPPRTSSSWTDLHGPLLLPQSRWSSPENRAPSPVPSIATPPRRSDALREATQRYETAIHRCAKDRQWQKAVKILQEMLDSPVCAPTVRAYTSAISACAKVGQSQKALELLEEMKHVGVAPNVLTYSAAISACEKARKCKLALSLLREMKKNGIEPDVISYNAAISACEKARKWRLALMLIQEMREEAGVRPDVISYSAAISACEKGGKLEHALELLQEMKVQGVKPDVILYNATISACDKRGAWPEAVGLLREMRAHDVEPDVISYSTAISACNRGGEADHAVMLLHQMRDQHVEPNGMAFVAAISACAKQNKLTMCLQLLQEMKVLGFNSEEGGEWEKAVGIIRKMTEGPSVAVVA